MKIGTYLEASMVGYTPFLNLRAAYNDSRAAE